MASNIFQHTNSIFAEAEQHEESNDATLGLELQQTQHDDSHFTENNLVGVVSDNPFASDARSASCSDGNNIGSEAAEPRDWTDTDPAAHQASHPVAKESTSSGADHDAFPDSVDPLESVDPLDTSLSGGSNTNHDPSGPGTDISVRPQSSGEQSGSRQHDSSDGPAEKDPRIAFATSDQVDSAHKSGLQGDRRATVQCGTISSGHDFSGKLVLSRNNSVVSMAKRQTLSSIIR
jgi:hypothetical protein